MYQEIINSIIPLLITASTGIISYIGITLKNKLVEKVDNDTKKSLVETTVKYVEQVFCDVHGKEKLDIALQKAEELFKEKGIQIGTTELEMMIEEVVNNLNNTRQDENK